jgi:hypothetical protein
MRPAVVTQWLQVSISDRPRRNTALRYASGVVVLQLGWVCLLFASDSVRLPVFGLLALG